MPSCFAPSITFDTNCLVIPIGRVGRPLKESKILLDKEKNNK
jgi:hypothetical protein